MKFNKIWGMMAAMAISLPLQAKEPKFTSITDPGNAVLQAVAAQIYMSFGEPINVQKAQLAYFVFDNNGPVRSTIDGVFFDDSQSQILHGVSIFNQYPGMNFEETYLSGKKMPDAGKASPPFITTDGVSVLSQGPGSGIRNDVDGVLELWVGADPFKTSEWFGAISGSNARPLRIGIHVSDIADYNNGGSASFLFENVSAVPELANWQVLLAGLPLMLAAIRRRPGQMRGSGARKSAETVGRRN